MFVLVGVMLMAAMTHGSSTRLYTAVVSSHEMVPSPLGWWAVGGSGRASGRRQFISCMLYRLRFGRGRPDPGASPGPHARPPRTLGSPGPNPGMSNADDAPSNGTASSKLTF